MLDLEPSEWPSHPVVLQQYLESRYYLVDQLLKDADVFGMAHSVEVRVPFLDHVLVEAALSSPLSWRFDDRWPKVLLTKALRDLLPGEVVFRRKQGFTFPMDMWLRTHGSAFGDTVSVVSKRGRDAVWEAFLSGRSHWSRPWALEVLAHVNK